LQFSSLRFSRRQGDRQRRVSAPFGADPLTVNFTIAIARIFRMAFEEALHFRLCLKTAKGKTLESLASAQGLTALLSSLLI
jgi:hypothetical protein